MSLRIKIDARLERKFRETAMKMFGYGKGALSRAAEEAILKWVSTVDAEALTFDGDPVEAIDGLLSDVDLDSVSLQHEAVKFWMSKVLKNVSG
ncbi:MAG: hypothetical protein QXI91_02815 [Candidatus Bathyarchaeia archaeon]